MTSNLNLYYDEEGDFLELQFGEFTEGYFKNLGNGIFERVDKKTEKVTGVAIMAFKKRTRDLKDLKVSLPVQIKVVS
ncbi:MAG TPA: hypothetical protein VJH22_00635 [Candidatus Nanoarchaeia archaeon]|nr:hypothetical protein [Candidatus Nanoarchaeia archaeon]